MLNIAPRVVVYPHGTSPPAVGEGWLALPQFDSWPPATLNLAPSPEPGSAVGSRHSMAQPRRAGTGPAPEPSRPQRHAVFGDGSHPTTRLCAGAVDLLCRQRPGLAVLDVGTGTGILARIAAARGANYVVGTDIDPTAVACARAHVELDSATSRGRRARAVAGAQAHAGLDVTSAAASDMRAAGAHAELDNDTSFGCRPPAVAGARARAEFDVTSAAAAAAPDMHATGAPAARIHFGSEAPDHWGARFDLVVANILEAPLHALAPALCRALKPSGVLLISGFTRPQAPALRLAFETTTLRAAGDFTLDGWVLLKFTQSFSR